MAELVIEVDAGHILRMLDQLGERAEETVHDASGETAIRLQEEWRARVRRRTGRYYEAITREEAEPPLRGWRVFVDTMSDPEGGTRAKNFALWQEGGTKYMVARPARESAIAIAEGAHLRVVEEALQDAIDEVNS